MTKSQLQKYIFLFTSVIIIGILFSVLHGIQSSKNTSAEAHIENGTQVIEIFAKNGYSPTKIQAKSNLLTILRIKTENTYDCSASLTIPDIKYSKFLQPTASTDVQLLPQTAGTKIRGSCSMGMYGFEIIFV